MVRQRRLRGWRAVPHAILGKAKLKERQRAIDFRKTGLSYSEILKRVPVAKSTLSLWLRSVGLSKNQEQRLTEKKLSGIRRGGEARRRQRIESTNVIFTKARAQIGIVSSRELWLIGTALYWAEGSKQKETNASVGVLFSNSDPQMMLLFQRWLIDVIKVEQSSIKYEIYIHRLHAHRLKDIQKYWARKLSLPVSEFNTVYYKNDKPVTNRKNTNNQYYGLIRLIVRSSTALNRTISGWIDGIVNSLGDRLTVGQVPLKH